jgi:hypothetical protein
MRWIRRTAAPEIHDIDDQQTIAFTPAGMEYLRGLLAEHKVIGHPPGPEWTVTHLVTVMRFYG